MDNRAKPDIAEEIAAALEWWRDAGVDCDFVDEPVNWTVSPEDLAAAVELPPPPPPVEVRKPAPTVANPALAPEGWPQELAAFADWWLTEPALDGGRATGRVPPRGPASPELMVLVEEPEEDDTDTLLSGRQGRMLNAFLQAAGIAPDQVYVASALPRHTPLADWPDLAARGFGALVAHHVRLVAPRRLLAFGGNILPLTGNDLPKKPAVLRTFYHEGGSIPLLAVRSLWSILDRPRTKAGLWQGWLDWIATDIADRDTAGQGTMGTGTT